MVLARRLACLLVIGLVHWLIHPGEVLTLYAVAGPLVLPVLRYLPDKALLALGIVSTVGAYALTGGGVATIPGVFVLGAAGARYGLPSRLEAPNRWIFVAAGVLAAVAAPALAWQLHQPGDPRFTNAGGIAGGILACLYIVLVSLLCATPARRVLRAVFEPLGRTAFTCYVTASCLAVPVGAALSFTATDDLVPAMVLATGIAVAQNLWARWWLKRFTYGPLEWIWRCVTWWRLVPIRRGS